MYLAGAFILLIGALTIIGVLISDISWRGSTRASGTLSDEAAVHDGVRPSATSRRIDDASESCVCTQGCRGAQPLTGSIRSPRRMPVAETRPADETKVCRRVAVAADVVAFRKHKLAVVSLWVIAIFYFVALFCGVPRPATRTRPTSRTSMSRPQGISFFDQNGTSRRPRRLRARRMQRNPETLRVSYVPDKTQWYPIQFFVHGEPYKLWGVWKSRPCTCSAWAGRKRQDAPFFLLGTDRLGRDMLSRIIYGTRISLSIGLVGVVAEPRPRHRPRRHLGLLRRRGRHRDPARDRVPPLDPADPALDGAGGGAAAGVVAVAASIFAITLILSLIGWTGLARVVRGRFLSLREEDFVMAARFCGASEARIIFRHMVPSFLSHIIASLTLAIPGMILAETSLSFLGLGLRPPAISWGVLLQEAQNVQTVALSPWLLLPGVRGDRRGPGVQLPRRWPARRGRSVRPVGRGARMSAELSAHDGCRSMPTTATLTA